MIASMCGHGGSIIFAIHSATTSNSFQRPLNPFLHTMLNTPELNSKYLLISMSPKNMSSRSESPFRSADNLAQILNLGEEESNQQSNEKPDHSRVTSRGAPARHSRRQRSEYRSWDRASDQPSKGRTGSKNRSTSRH